jgi:hypothetical protein
MITILSQFHLLPILNSHLPEIYLNIILPSPSRSSKWAFFKSVPSYPTNVVSLTLATYSALQSLLHFTILTTVGVTCTHYEDEQYKGLIC